MYKTKGGFRRVPYAKHYGLCHWSISIDLLSILTALAGVHDMSIDKEKETVTVKGTMDVNALVENLMGRLKRKVEVVPAKKDKNKEKEGGEGKEASNGGGKKKKGSGGDNGKAEEGFGDDGRAKMDQSKMEVVAPAYGYGYGDSYNYGTVYMEHLHAPQMFSDENPNACSVM